MIAAVEAAAADHAVGGEGEHDARSRCVSAFCASVNQIVTQTDVAILGLASSARKLSNQTK